MAYVLLCMEGCDQLSGGQKRMMGVVGLEVVCMKVGVGRSGRGGGRG